MFNKLKKAVKYVAKKIKQGVEIVAEISKDIITSVSEVGKEVVSGTKDVINAVGTTAVNRYADYMDKKLDLGKSICNGVCNGVKTAGKTVLNETKTAGKALCNVFRKPSNRKITGLVLTFAGVGLFISGYIKQEAEV